MKPTNIKLQAATAITRLRATAVTALSGIKVTDLDKCKPAELTKAFRTVGKKFGAYFEDQGSKNEIVFPVDEENIWAGHLQLGVLPGKSVASIYKGKLVLGYSSTRRTGIAGAVTTMNDLKRLLPKAETKMGFEEGDINHQQLFKTVEALLEALDRLAKVGGATDIKASATDDVAKVFKGLTADKLKAGVDLNPAQLNTLLQILTSMDYEQSGSGKNMQATKDGEKLEIAIDGDTITVKLLGE